MDVEIDVFDLLTDPDVMAALEAAAASEGDVVRGVSLVFMPVGGDPASGYDVYIDYLAESIPAVPPDSLPASPHTL